MTLESLRSGALWRHIAVEILIVSVGILIAFALDSWWQGRQDAGREQRHLAALASDFRENALRLRRRAASEGDLHDAAGQLLTLMDERPQATREEVVPLLSRVFSNSTFEPVLGAYESIVSAGDLDLIHDEELRRSLVAFASRVASARFEQLPDTSYASFIAAAAGSLQMRWWGPGGDTATVSGRRPWSTAALFDNPGFEDRLVFRMVFAESSQTYFAGLADRADGIVARIEASSR